MRTPGSTLADKYEIVEALGHGGMGEVYLARHLHLEQLRVIKILRQDLTADDTAQKRFTREARLATQVKHPNVAILYDFDRLPEGSFYMVWEHIEGENIGELLAARGPFGVLPAIQLGIQALRGLEAIHANGVVHRDISPDNLMLTHDRRGRELVKIIDLGLAKNLVTDPNFEITEVGTFMGKLRYCSPEQAQVTGGGALDPTSDLYSFALVLYEMICGLPPFEAENPHALVMKRLSEEPLPLSGRNPEVEVPAALDEALRQALARRRQDRFPSAVALIEAIEKVAFELRGLATRKTPVPRAVEPAPETRPASAAAERELSREERSDLLARIEEAARRQEITQAINRIEQLIDEGELAEARRMVERIRAEAPEAHGLARLERRLTEIEAATERRRRLEELERMIETAIKQQRLPMAQLTLETLLEIHPTHPRRADYESWIGILHQEVEDARRDEEALAAGRQALARGDLRAARRQLLALARRDAESEPARELAAAIEAAEREERTGVEIEEHRRRFEEVLAAGDFDRAAQEIERLRTSGASRVTVDFLRSRLDDQRSRSRREARERSFEKRYRQRLDAADWYGAREVALELERALPASSRPAEMFAEIVRLEEAAQRRQAVAQGVHQVEELLAAGQVDQAQLALTVLLKMDPDNRHRRSLEKKIRALKG